MFYFEEKNDLTLYKSSILDDENIIHAFTTRIGMEENSEENRKKICETLGINYKNLVIPEQMHTDNIKIVSSPHDDVSNCDAVVTEVPELFLMLHFADCVPVILYSPDKHVVSVVHAGWRGTAKSIGPKTLNIMKNKFDVDISLIKASIGAAIGQCCYPVSKEVADELRGTIVKKCDNLFTTNVNDNILVNVDLKKLNEQQLREFGVKYIDTSDNCTSCMNSVFYSYRAENGKIGRHAAIAGLRR